MAGTEDNWRTQTFRQSVVSKIEEVIQRSGMQVARNSSEMENHVFMKAKTREEYMNMVAKLILHVREMSQPKQNQGGQNMQGPNQNQGGQPSQGQNQQGQQQGPNSQSNLAPDPINALQTLASQGSRNQMMGMGPQGPMQQQMGGNPGMGGNPNMGGNPGMGMQMGQQGPISSQGPQVQPATNLLQTLNQRPQMNMQLQKQLGGGPMGMTQSQMGGMQGGMGMGNMGSQLQSQLAGPNMQGQMMSIQNSMQPMGGGNSMGQMPCNQMGQMAPNSMQGQMGGQMDINTMVEKNNSMPNILSPDTSDGSGDSVVEETEGDCESNNQVLSEMFVPGMSNNQMVGMSMLHMQQRGVKQEGGMGGMMYAGGSRAPPPAQFLRQSPSPSAPSPGMGGPSPVPMGVMGSTMPSPMGGLGALGACGGVGSPSPSGPPHLSHHVQQQPRNVGMGMVASPSSSLNTPLGGGVASPGGEEAAYREKVRQLSKYIEPLRRMVHRMVSEGENVEKLTKMKNLLDILSNPSKRMPLETLIKCEVVLEKLDFKRGEPMQGVGVGVGVGVGLPGAGKEQIFNPLLEVVNNCLQSPLANHTLKRTFGSTLDSLNGPEIKNLPPPHKLPKLDEPEMEIPDVLQGEIARLDSRFKVSLEPMQLSGGKGAISLVAQLDDARLPCVPSVHVLVPRDYPAAPPARPRARLSSASPFLHTVLTAMDARAARLPKSCSVGQLLDAWEMSVRQASAPSPVPYTPVPALGL